MVALVKIVSGDTESYDCAVYKGEVIQSFKGVPRIAPRADPHERSLAHAANERSSGSVRGAPGIRTSSRNQIDFGRQHEQ